MRHPCLDAGLPPRKICGRGEASVAAQKADEALLAAVDAGASPRRISTSGGK